jgi:5-methylcytosine-specific restriction endonuclease McrA
MALIKDNIHPVKELYKQGLPLLDISNRLNLKEGTVAHIVSVYGLNKQINRINKGRFTSLHQYSKRNRFPKGKNNPNWRDIKLPKIYPLGWTHIYREQIRMRDDYKCQICGVPEIECNRKLAVHHIDYDKKNIHADNLITLCGRCHGKTDKNRDYWINYLRRIKEIIG